MVISIYNIPFRLMDCFLQSGRFTFGKPIPECLKHYRFCYRYGQTSFVLTMTLNDTVFPVDLFPASKTVRPADGCSGSACPMMMVWLPFSVFSRLFFNVSYIWWLMVRFSDDGAVVFGAAFVVC